MNKFILGGGGHGRVVLDALLAEKIHVAGIIDAQLSGLLIGIPVLGDDDLLDKSHPTTAELYNGVGANPDVAPRRALFNRFAGRGFRFPFLRHPSAVIGRACSLGDGAQVMAGAIIQTGAALGANVVVNTGARVDHDCNIGAHSFIGPGAILCGGVTVEESAFIGAGAIILPGVLIGEGAIVGAGSVVLYGVAAGTTVVGNPLREIRLDRKAA